MYLLWLNFILGSLVYVKGNKNNTHVYTRPKHQKLLAENNITAIVLSAKKKCKKIILQEIQPS